jgi:hypothetical protein
MTVDGFMGYALGMSSVIVTPLESLDVLDVYPAAPQLDDPSLLQKGEGLGHSLALGADHGR